MHPDPHSNGGGSPLKTYLAPILVSALFVLGSPILLFTIFLSGDSCCGGNTTGTMAFVTGFIVVALLAVSLGLSGLVKLAVKDRRRFKVIVSSAIMAGPTATICIGVFLWLAATSF